MDVPSWTKMTQDKVLENLKKVDFNDPNWAKPFTEFDTVTKHNVVIWYLKELVEKREYVDEIFAIAKIYAEDKDPTPTSDSLNEKIEKGEEVRYLTSVRGTNCWLLAAIAATFRTKYYPEIISILEKLAFDPVYYVRIQATVPLSFFAQNIRARQHPDGKPFDFRDEDRKRVADLSFRMLQEHRDLPRVLEGVTNIFNALRAISEGQARQVIESFFYNSKGQIQPEYITHQAVPLLLFFAEYRSNLGDGFNGKWFQDFAIKLLKLPEAEAPHLKSTFIWHTWKEIQSDVKNYDKFKKYIPFFFNEEFEIQPLGQYDFLVKEVLKASPADGVALYKQLLEYVLKWAPKYDVRQHAWLLTTHEIVEEIAKVSPQNLLEILHQVTSIISHGIYVGYLETIYKSYLLVPDKDQGMKMHPEILKMYEVAKKLDRFEKLPDTV